MPDQHSQDLFADDPFVDLDATEQGRLVRAGDVTPGELVDAAIARVEAVNPQINAVTATLYDAARDAAAAPGRREGRFAGVPYLIKDLAALGRAPLTFGSRQFATMRVRDNEAIVDRALGGGVIVLGKTNTPEFGLLPSTEPLLHGPTRNPWSLAHSPGGSSGGAAAAVAAGLTPFAHGGDGGGSIRIPASACGVFGFKPSRGRVLPPLRQPPGALSVNLCVSRSVRDTAGILAESEWRGIGAPFPPIGCISEPSTRRLRIALQPRSILGAPAAAPIAAALDDVAALCESLGHHVEEADPLVEGEEAVHRFLGFWAGVPAQIVRSIWLFRLRTWRYLRLEDAFEPWTLGLADWYHARQKEEGDVIARSEAYFEEVAPRVDAFFDRYDVVLSPVLRLPTAQIGELAPTVPFDTLLERCVDTVAYTPVNNALGQPAMSVPLSTGPDGLPIGAHFAAKRGDDATLLALAYELEAARPWMSRRAKFGAPLH